MRSMTLGCLLAALGCASPAAGTVEDGVATPAPWEWEPPPPVVTMDPPPPPPGIPPEPPEPMRPDAPPIGGGTLLATRDGLLVAGDELTDRLFVVDPEIPAVVGSLRLAPGAWPGRMTEDEAGRVHVVARGTGELLRFDPRAPERPVLATKVCAQPRGIDLHEDAGLIRVACASGALLGLTPDHELRERWDLEPDLRDVVASRDRVFVTTFRSAELLVLDGGGRLLTMTAPPEATFSGVTPPAVMVPRVAWRMRAASTGVIVSHQRQVSTNLDAFAMRSSAGAITYYGGASTRRLDVPTFVLEQRITRFDRDGGVVETRGTTSGRRFSQLVDLADMRGSVVGAWASDGGVGVATLSGDRFAILWQDEDTLLSIHEPGYADQHVPRPARLEGIDQGRQVFHAGSDAGIACASCHPEGHEDGHTWRTRDLGPRRSQSLLGGLSETAPFHWGGELRSFDALMDEQSERLLMPFSDGDRRRMLAWLDRQPAPDPVSDALDVQAFREAGCDTCHGGARGSDAALHDVGAGAVLTPRLEGVWARAPFLHDGCAESLDDALNGACRDVAAHGVADPALRARVVAHLRAL